MNYLHYRLLTHYSKSYFVSPNGETLLNDHINIQMKFNQSDVTDDTVPVIIYWDTGQYKIYTQSVCNVKLIRAHLNFVVILFNIISL